MPVDYFMVTIFWVLAINMLTSNAKNIEVNLLKYISSFNITNNSIYHNLGQPKFFICFKEDLLSG